MIEKAYGANENKVNIYQLLLVFIVFYISDDTVLFGTNISQVFIISKYVLYTLLCLGLGVVIYIQRTERELKPNRYKGNFLIFVIYLSYILTMAVNLDFRPGYLIELIVFTLAVCIVNTVNFKEFFIYFNKILYFFCLCSLGVLVLNFTVPFLIRIFPTAINYANTEFYNLFITVVFKEMSFFRNTGIFREPGVFIIYLNIGLIYQLFVLPKSSLKHIIVFTLALFTTLSTTGFLVLLVIVLGAVFRKSTLKMKLISSFVVVTFILIFLLNPAINELVFGKLNEESSEYISAFSRLSSFSVPLWIFFNNPFFGSGLTRFVDLYSLYSLKLFGFELEASQASTNTIFNKFATFGVIYGSIVIYGLFNLARILGKKFLVGVCLFAAFFVLFSSQEMRFSLLFYIILFYGIDISSVKIKDFYLNKVIE
ncbi:hypothetical protein [Pedobacter immunditicola]|uniref:hypothetical protein n=1 Tax=Pedobacter immunditicola TaxID=3133440 RepID=UPI0030A3D6C0